ncbi:MAG: nicotinate (nicotinamide) nucleotide adenylyltransferase [Oscillospiraceae bacterium]
MKIGIFGGTFDPPHKGHTSAAKAAIKQLGLNKLLVIPDAEPPHKSLPEDAPTAEERLELTRAAFGGVKKTVVSDMEILRGGMSYTVDTVGIVADKYPDAKLYLLMGTDMFLCFETWKEFRTILQKVTLAVFSRRSGETDELYMAADRFRERYGASVEIVLNDEVDISSTDLRGLLRLRRGLEFLDEPVYAEIIRRRPYGAKPDFSWLRKKAHAMLKPSRIPHVMGCEEEAQRLAKWWGADVEKAREAAILHDITKKEELEAQLILCRKYGIIPDEIELKEGKLLHSKTGAAIAKYEFGCDDEIYGAIFWHTTGRENMTLLEKVMYMADYIEPTRSFDGVDKLRRLAYEDIDKALKLGFEMSIDDMRERGIVPHSRTMRALEWITEVLKDKE